MPLLFCIIGFTSNNDISKRTAAMAIDGLMHIGVYTKDMTESMRLYTEILGFQVQWHGIVDHVTGKIEAAKIALGYCIVELVKPANLENVHESNWRSIMHDDTPPGVLQAINAQCRQPMEPLCMP